MTQKIRKGIAVRNKRTAYPTVAPVRGITDQHFDDELQASIIPAGAVLPFGGGTVPDGYLLCDGSALSRTVYSSLFAAIGTAHGAGDGSSTFNIPDLRGRAPVGAGQGAGLTNRTLGQKFGAETHALSVAEMPSHNHGGTTGNDSPDHSHNYLDPHNAGSWAAVRWWSANDSSYRTLTTYGANQRHAHSIPAQGSGTAHNNMQPSTVLNFVIKY